MKTRSGWVANSSSSSFVVALRKGHTLYELVKNAGDLKSFAQSLVDYLKGEITSYQSVENVALYAAMKDYGNRDNIVDIANDEYSYLAKRCESMVDKPDEWFFAVGDSCNDDDNPISLMIYNGDLEIHGENFVLKSGGY